MKSRQKKLHPSLHTPRQKEYLRLKTTFPRDDLRDCESFSHNGTPNEDACTGGYRANRCNWNPLVKKCSSIGIPTYNFRLPVPDVRHKHIAYSRKTPTEMRKTSGKRHRLSTGQVGHICDKCTFANDLDSKLCKVCRYKLKSGRRRRRRRSR